MAILLHVPDVLASGPEPVELLLSHLRDLPCESPVTLALDDVRFVYPYGAVMLLGLCHYLARVTGYPVRLVGIRREVHAYLRRIDFFEREGTNEYTTDPFAEAADFSRSSASLGVLELVWTTTPADVYQVSGSARRILTYWLNGASYDIDQVVTMLAEVCANAVDHSHDAGFVMIQKYDHGHYVEVKLAIADIGIGIRGSLVAAHPDLRDTCAGCIERALAGLSSRAGPRGGHGLGAISRIAIASGGSLQIRSETGLVQVVSSASVLAQDDLAFFPGTQVGITFRSRT